MTVSEYPGPAGSTTSLLIRPTQKDFVARTTGHFDFLGRRPPCIMKSNSAGRTAKSLLCLFSTAVVLAVLHLISSHIKNMFFQEYVKYTYFSIIYMILKRFYEIN